MASKSGVVLSDVPFDASPVDTVSLYMVQVKTLSTVPLFALVYASAPEQAVRNVKFSLGPRNVRDNDFARVVCRVWEPDGDIWRVWDDRPSIV